MSATLTQDGPTDVAGLVRAATPARQRLEAWVARRRALGIRPPAAPNVRSSADLRPTTGARYVRRWALYRDLQHLRYTDVVEVEQTDIDYAAGLRKARRMSPGRYMPADLEQRAEIAATAYAMRRLGLYRGRIEDFLDPDVSDHFLMVPSGLDGVPSQFDDADADAVSSHAADVQAEVARAMKARATADALDTLELARAARIAPAPLLTARTEQERNDDPDPPVQLLTLTDVVLTAAPPRPRGRTTHAA